MKNLISHNNALVDKSQALEEREVKVASLKPFFEDYDLVPVFGKLKDLPLLVCVTTPEGDFVVFHESLWQVLLERRVKKVKALFFKGVWDLAELFYLREKLFRRRKKVLAEFYYFAYKNFYGEDFYRKRAQVIQAICQKAGIRRQTAYAYLWRHLKEEKEELKKLVQELYSQGKTQMEIARLLGVPQQTISDWLKKGRRGKGEPLEEVSHDGTS
jgi:DNA-directed RNA polymerase specialized sigma24 family protein